MTENTRPAILDNPEAFVVVPVNGTTAMHKAWYCARDTIVGGYYADKGPYEALLDARPDPTALADLVAYTKALEELLVKQAATLSAENARLREALEPFSKFAGLVFERNFNNDDPVDTMTASDGGQAKLYARDFFSARAVLSTKGEA